MELPMRADRDGARVGELDVAAALSLDAPRIDLRSPAEFAEDHLPGAVNVPLFDDAERAVVGTLYKQAGTDAAHARALAITRAKVHELVSHLAEASRVRFDAGELAERVEAIAAGGVEAMERRLAGRRVDEAELVLCCWRGGLRSRSVAALLGGLGIGAAVVRGGYKAYRRLVLDTLSTWNAPPAFVLRGLTGVGKTLVLESIERRRPGSTVDLEALADHRSSILGAVGRSPVSQKAFDGALAARIRRGFPHGFVVFEGESRKVGSTVLPDCVWGALERGTSIGLVAPMERRVEVLLADYLASAGARDALRPGLGFIEGRLGAKHAGLLTGLLDAGRDAELCEIVLERYYDPLYRHAERGRAVAVTIDATDPDRAARDITTWIDRERASLGRRAAHG